MTVIATDGVWLASDSRATGASTWRITSDRIRKIHHLHRSAAIIAFCGTDMSQAMIEWFNDGANPRHMPKVDATWGMLLITTDGMRYYYKDIAPHYEDIADFPWACGNGAELAIGAMEAGASVKCAVEIAIKRDCSCGGAVQLINIQEALGVQPVLKLAGGQ